MNYEQKILIADSDEISCLLYEEYLQERFNCVIVNDGQKAIDLIKSNSNICLVITEIRLKLIDGFNLLKEIRKMKKNIPIFVHTSTVTEDVKKECLNIGFTEFIPKPFQYENFYSLIIKYLPN